MDVTSASEKRFVVLGGPGGYLSCRPAGCPLIADRYKRWLVLFKVNRPLTLELGNAAKDAVFRRFELLP